MAIKTLRIDDDVVQSYEVMDPKDPSRAMVNQLAKFQYLTPQMRPLLFKDPQRARLEKLYGKPIEDNDKFVEWVEHMLHLEMWKTRLKLNAKQIATLEKQAGFWKKTPAEFLEEKIAEGLTHAIGW